jgi:Ca-activated chloride channel family protein
MMKTIQLLAGSLLICGLGAQATERSMLVLDVSGSMWGQIDGKPKIEIARDALKTLVADWPATHEVGLVAYGHRRKDDCQDIETLIPVGTVDSVHIGQVVDALTPKGKTPLSAAVKQAANDLKYTEEKANVILISDGVETCDLDPCALGKEL